MKYTISSILLAFTFLFTISTQETQAQNNNRNTKRSTKASKGISKNSSSRSVKSNNVTYKRPKRKVTSVRTLPNRRTINYNGANYYYANNRFYNYSGGRYTSIIPQVGFRIREFPRGYRTIRHGNINYRWLNGMFYVLVNNNEYEIVNPEIGTVIYELPNNYDRVVINGLTYYEFSNVLYEKIQVNGTRAYEVVGFIEQ